MFGNLAILAVVIISIVYDQTRQFLILNGIFTQNVSCSKRKYINRLMNGKFFLELVIFDRNNKSEF